MRAWEKIETKGQPPVSFQKFLQRSKELYSEFIARLQETIKKQVNNLEAAYTLLQLIAYENANADCQKVIGPIKGKIDIIRIYQVMPRSRD